MAAMTRTALHVSPHPDDEVLGCGATLLALRAAGWRVVNLACGLGRPADWERRRGELDAALAVLGIEGVVADPPAAMSRGDDLDTAEGRLADLVTDVAGRIDADLLVSPHPEDAHHAHAVVGRAVARTGAGDRWWSWGLWRDLPAPNRYVPYGPEVLERLMAALRCHAGELARNDYEDLLRSRARLQAVLGSERVLGFGSAPAAPEPFADLLEERARAGDGRWQLAPGGALGVAGRVLPVTPRRRGAT